MGLNENPVSFKLLSILTLAQYFCCLSSHVDFISVSTLSTVSLMCALLFGWLSQHLFTGTRCGSPSGLHQEGLFKVI